jgi:hypothetical protein
MAELVMLSVVARRGFLRHIEQAMGCAEADGGRETPARAGEGVPGSFTSGWRGPGSLRSLQGGDHSMTRLGRVRLPGELLDCQELPAVPESVRLARRRAREALYSWRLPPHGIDNSELLVSEIVTNAIRYGGSQRSRSSGSHEVDRITVVLRYMPDELTIEVSDSNQVPPVLSVPDISAPGWRGLNIINDLSRKWGYYNLPPSGKTVYCVVDCG